VPEKQLREDGFVPSRTRIVCLHEGEAGRSIDGLFILALLKELDPPWARLWDGSNIVRPVPCGGRSTLLDRMPGELKTCLAAGSDTTLMIWADLDHDMADGDVLKREFWKRAKAAEISKADFDQVVFVFSKDRLENWIQFLETGDTDEAKEGPRVKYPRQASDAAKRLAEMCRANLAAQLPASLTWSCSNWRQLVERMKG
jgi:hypothetical protein